MNKGECDVGILSETHIQATLAGDYNVQDCDKIDAGMTEEAAADTNSGALCDRNSNGKPDLSRDCNQFVKVGQPVIAIPVSMPMSQNLQPRF